jgi:hypothetical protein
MSDQEQNLPIRVCSAQRVYSRVPFGLFLVYLPRLRRDPTRHDPKSYRPQTRDRIEIRFMGKKDSPIRQMDRAPG